MFEPGESWDYSVGIDWAGEMVMRVSNMSLEDYMKKNIWEPLGIKHLSFFPKKNPEIMSRLVDMTERDCPVTMFGTAEDPNAKLKHTDRTVWDMESVACHGGVGGYGSPLDHQKILHSICADDGKLLKSATIDEMFKPQLTEGARAKIQELMQIPEANQAFGGFPLGMKADWGLGGIMNLNALPGRSAGSIAWGGYPNLLWYIDRSSGMSGIVGTQIIPPGDVKVSDLMNNWTVATYKEAGVGIKEKL